MVAATAEAALAQGEADIEKIKALTVNGKSAQDNLTALVAKIGENMTFRRAAMLEVKQGAVISYIHNAATDKAGKIGVLVALESTASADKLNALGRQIAMHIAAARPDALDRGSVDASKLEREKSVLVEQARASGKPENIIEKMVEGRINKFYEEIVLLEQAFVINPDMKVSAVVEAAAKEAGAPIKLVAFERFALGEGIEKKDDDFAAEVAAMAK